VRSKISKSTVDALTPGDILADIEVKGFVARCLPSGAVTYGLRYRAAGKQRWLALGLHGRVTPDQARKAAKKRVGEVADDRDPAREHAEERARAKLVNDNTVGRLLDSFIDHYARRRLRGAREVERVFNKYVRPRIGSKSIYEVRRRHVVEMLDEIEDQHGPGTADHVLAYLRTAFNWQAARDDEFVPPIVRGMARTKPSERARKRVLADDEIRDVWAGLDAAKMPAPFPKLVRALFLTAQRRDEVARMRWEEIDGDTWVIPAERYKTNTINAVPLTPAALHLLGDPQNEGFVFSTTQGKKPFSGFSKAKAALDKVVAELRVAEGRKPMPPWVLHDLRRTARSLMSRAGVSADIAERVLGHVIPGVRGVYDRHSFIEEKRDALERLAHLMSRILEAADRERRNVATCA
jgi:integrase